MTEQGFVEVVVEHERLLNALARRLCGNDADAADLVHDTYERALRAWQRHAGSRHLRNWLVAILHNLFVDRCRKARRRPLTEAIDLLDLAAPEPSAPPAWSNVSDEQVSAALATIGAEFRVVYELHTHGRSYAEIAAELNIPRPTVGTRLVRARKKLKDALLRELDAERDRGAGRGPQDGRRAGEKNRRDGCGPGPIPDHTQDRVTTARPVPPETITAARQVRPRLRRASGSRP